MHKHYHVVESPQLGRRVSLWVYGHFGVPVLVFPSAAGMAHEWDLQGMTEVLAPLINAGKIKLYCTESNVSETWTNKEADPRWRIERHMAFENYVYDTLVPWIRNDCETDDIRLSVTGVSVGALYSANCALKRPQDFRYALCMSGLYNLTRFTDGFTNDSIYFSNPLAYSPGLGGDLLATIQRNTHLTLVCGQGRYEETNVEDTNAFAGILSHKEISHEVDMWGHDVDHSWPWWQRQALHHLGKTFGG